MTNTTPDMADQKAAQTPVGGVEGKTVTDNPATIESANLTDHVQEYHGRKISRRS